MWGCRTGYLLVSCPSQQSPQFLISPLYWATANAAAPHRSSKRRIVATCTTTTRKVRISEHETLLPLFKSGPLRKHLSGSKPFRVKEINKKQIQLSGMVWVKRKWMRGQHMHTVRTDVLFSMNIKSLNTHFGVPVIGQLAISSPLLTLYSTVRMFSRSRRQFYGPDLFK